MATHNNETLDQRRERLSAELDNVNRALNGRLRGYQQDEYYRQRKQIMAQLAAVEEEASAAETAPTHRERHTA